MVKSMKKNTEDGAKIYTALTLKLYDWWDLGCLLYTSDAADDGMRGGRG
ncbi:hypothetical protein ACH0C5_22275, partial [Escherichia coli]